MKVIITILILTLSCSSALAFDRWDNTEKVMGGMYLLATAVDWRQTVNIAHNPDKYYEKNDILGEHPSEARVNRYFLLATIVKLGIAHVLPHTIRKIWLGAIFVVSANCVKNNHALGIKLEW